jgi:hypothetical protein
LRVGAPECHSSRLEDGWDRGLALGYSIVGAETIEDAVALLAECPMDMWVYEAMPM